MDGIGAIAKHHAYLPGAGCAGQTYAAFQQVLAAIADQLLRLTVAARRAGREDYCGKPE